MRGFELDVELLDVQQLNDGLFGGRYDISKASFHAALLLSDRFVVLASGAALGFGVGPLLVAAGPRDGAVAAVAGAVPGRDHHRDAALPLPAPPPGHDHPGRVHRHRPRAAARRRRPGRAHPRGPAHLPARRPDAGRGPGHVVRAAGGCARAAGRDPGRPGAARRHGRRVRGLLRESIAYGWANRDEALVTIRAPRPGDGRERDLALRRAVRQRPHRRPRPRGCARARGARANRARGGPVCRRICRRSP